MSRPSLTPRGVSAVDHVCPDTGSGLLAAYEQWRGHADGQACCDYGLSVDIPRWHESLREELEALVKDKGKGRGSPARAGVTAGPPGTQRCGDTQRGHAPSSGLGPPHPWPSGRELWVGHWHRVPAITSGSVPSPLGNWQPGHGKGFWKLKE